MAQILLKEKKVELLLHIKVNHNISFLDGERVAIQRIERIISNRGFGSRSEVIRLFRDGLVKINGQTIRSGADKYPVDVIITIDGDVQAIWNCSFT